MKKFTANYSKTNHNFVIQGLPKERVDNDYLPAICIIKNIIQRGRPTLMSKFLQEQIGEIHIEEDFNEHFGLIDFTVFPVWNRTIKGDETNDNFPARTFFEKNISQDLPEYTLITRLIVPEYPINEITQTYIEKYQNQKVDFFLSFAQLVIEIDGQQHKEISHRLSDDIRDNHLARHNIKTIRIDSFDLANRNEIYFKKIEEIKVVLEQYKNTISFYGKFYKPFNEYSSHEVKTKLLPTAIIRFQLLILSLLEYGVLSLDNEIWNIVVKNHDIEEYENIAIKDLFIWFRYLFKLQKLIFKEPDIQINKQTDTSLTRIKNVKIDFSILKRWTDQDEVNSDTLFVRTDYHDMFWNDAQGKKSQVNYFKVSTAKIIKYKLSVTEDNDDKLNLSFFLNNIFGYKEFNEGQYPILQNALAYKDTLGLLPTGGGKSLTYQLACLLQPAISFVVCPIKALMYDQKEDLEQATIQHVDSITSDNIGAEREDILQQFGSGKFFFVFISPERFQTQDFRQRLLSIKKYFQFSYAVIDEVHCISEWGHDFRTSYLNLSSTIKGHCGDIRFLGLTATASVHVLKDIQIEFDISQENVKTLVDYTRPELHFEVINDKNNKFQVITNLLRSKNEIEKIFTVDGKNTNCGLIFTPYVNGKHGCFDLANNIKANKAFKQQDLDVHFYSGSKPKNFPSNINFDTYKNNTQNQYKSNKFPLLVATKAFGMGINKENIRYTIHYGIPSSMEALYQEAGRAGRDRRIANCYVLLSEENVNLDTIFNTDSTYEQIEEFSNSIGFKGQDVFRQIFLYQKSLDSIESELTLLSKIHQAYSKPNTSVTIHSKKIGESKQSVEKAIYRLSNLGIVDDWTVDDFFNGIFTIYYANYNEDSIKNTLISFIRKYVDDFKFDDHRDRKRYTHILNDLSLTPFKSMAKVLLQWTYDKFSANRRASLRNVYDNCLKYENTKQGKDNFKKALEAYFKFTQATHILQYIAENNNKNPQKWFEIFYEKDKILISNNKLIDLDGNLQRMIESYQNNTGLNLIIAITKILLGISLDKTLMLQRDKALSEIKNYNFREYDYIRDQIFNLSIIAGNLYQSEFLDLLYKTCKSFEQVKELAMRVGDIKKLLPDFNKRLNSVLKEFADGIE
jgi:ATP-dependent DNA helicase RecQ